MRPQLNLADFNPHPLNLMKIIFNIITAYYTGFPSHVLSFSFPSKISHAFITSPMHVTCPNSIILLDLIILIIF
jgi:hypothetical protein